MPSLLGDVGNAIVFCAWRQWICLLKLLSKGAFRIAIAHQIGWVRTPKVFHRCVDMTKHYMRIAADQFCRRYLLQFAHARCMHEVQQVALNSLQSRLDV